MDTIARIAIISDAICPWCYIGKRQLDRALPVLAAEGMQISTSGFLIQLNPDMPVGGRPRAEYRARKFGSVERARELDARVTQAAAAVGLDFHMDRIQHHAQHARRAPARVVRLRNRYGGAGRARGGDVQRVFRRGPQHRGPRVLADCAASVGMDRATTLAFIAGEEGREAVLTQDEAARGAPA